MDVSLEQGIHEDCNDGYEEKDLNHLDASASWQLVADANEPIG